MKNYFKNFSIMFIMILAIVGVGIFKDGIMANAATIGQQLLEPETGWRRYEDSNSEINYTGTWYVGDIHNTSPYGASGSITGSSAKLNFDFYGSKLRIITYADPNGSKNVKITIDGTIYDAFTSYNNSNMTKRLSYEITGLGFGKHTVLIENQSNNSLYFDAIDIDKEGYLLPYNEQVESMSLDKSTMNLIEGDSSQLTATTTPEAVGVTWKSSDPSIATIEVDPTNGKITKVNALKEGTSTITATTADGSNLSASCIINVTKKDVPQPTEPTGTDNIVNIAHAKGDNTNNAGGDVTIIFHGSADTTLSVIKTADVKDVWVGDNFTYTIVVTNTGTKTAKAVVVNDPAPNHIDFLVNGVTSTQGKIDPSSTSKNIIVNVGDIPPLGTVTIKIPATVIL
ncbi:Ig-like domain-containing protein [Clostridium beijerinckii]|uniref:Repeat protein (TIGR01451 family) n=1 Tax=Clostridium beijerinckii TaxID=1520 RepID=A0AAX0B544_CLOBE|nr:Ig-like domain-containing protein [Clostridium beijerinckii]NRT90014.1 putative repeat protein (TIGR01451 family) [Clostridium beijerinckii]NYC69545.1 putative repeat protein (TIGR01451 family) [Clostridium beijerinckii]